MGGGKTTTAKLIHSTIPRTFLIGPDYIKYGISDYNNTSTRDTRNIHLALQGLCSCFLSMGYNVIFDEGFRNMNELKGYLDLAKKSGVKLIFAQIYSDPEICLQRALARKIPKRGHKVSKMKIRKRIEAYFRTKYRNPDLEFDSEKMNPEMIADKISLFIAK